MYLRGCCLGDDPSTDGTDTSGIDILPAVPASVAIGPVSAAPSPSVWSSLVNELPQLIPGFSVTETPQGTVTTVTNSPAVLAAQQTAAGLSLPVLALIALGFYFVTSRPRRS